MSECLILNRAKFDKVNTYLVRCFANVHCPDKICFDSKHVFCLQSLPEIDWAIEVKNTDKTREKVKEHV